MKLFWRVLGFLIVLVLALSACGSKNGNEAEGEGVQDAVSPLVGRWRSGGVSFEFFEDGMGTLTWHRSTDEGRLTTINEFSWEVSDDSITIVSDEPDALDGHLINFNRFSISENGQGLTLYAYGEPVHYGRWD